MPKLFRIADNYHRGVYRAVGDPYKSIHGTDDVDISTHPNPYDDRLLYKTWIDMSFNEQQKHRFGFASPRQMHSWFDEKAFKKLQAISRRMKKKEEGRGLFVYVFSGPIVQGAKQAVANLEECKLLKSIPIEKFYPKKRKKRKVKKSVDIVKKRDTVIPCK